MSYRIIPVLLVWGFLPSHPGAVAQSRPAPTAPEAFTSQVQFRTGAGSGATNIRIQIDRYTDEVNRKRVTDGMTYGGYPGLLGALRKAPVVGQLQIGDESFPVRWTREQSTTKGRNITIVTDKPVYFIGGGRTDAKPRAGYELAVVQLAVDDSGTGTGTMAAAARIKPDGTGGVLLDDYAAEPIKLTFVRREVK
jgi:hypothetical protein